MKILGEFKAADWRRPSVIALVLANLVPVIGVFYFHWDVFPLMFLFWSENVIIGAINILKMLCATQEPPIKAYGKLFIIPFFCFHYSLFCYGHGFIIARFFGGVTGFPGPGIFLQIMRNNHLEWVMIGFVVSRGISFVTNFLLGREYQRTSASDLFDQPYARVIVLHVALIFGGAVLMFLNS
ncbi:MAG: DUF6498-containing protein, partial [Verrucomicrobiota bacterium]